jgi:hypothetical protein
MGVAVFAKIKERHGPAAGIGDPVDGNVNNGARSCIIRETGAKFVKPRVVGRDDRAEAVKAYDHGWTLNRAEHDDDSTIFSKMGHCLCTASGVVLIGNFQRPENPERFASLWRNIYVTVWGKGGGGHKEDSLPANPWASSESMFSRRLLMAKTPR